MSDSRQLLQRTVALSVLAWSAGTAVVVHTGLGARYSLHPDRAIEASAVPAVQLQRSRLAFADLQRYAVIGERPLFNFDRRPLPSEDGSQAEQVVAPPPAPLNVLVTSIVITKDHKIAIVTDPATKKATPLRVGGSLEGDQSAWRLVELSPRGAVFEGPGGRSSLELRAFDGQGGEPPTPIALPSTPPSGASQGGSTVIQEQAASATESGAETPESRAEQIRRRIEERRRQLREEADRAKAERGE